MLLLFLSKKIKIYGSSQILVSQYTLIIQHITYLHHGLVWVFQKTLIFWNFPKQPLQKRKHPVIHLSGWQCLGDVRDELQQQTNTLGTTPVN